MNQINFFGFFKMSFFVLNIIALLIIAICILSTIYERIAKYKFNAAKVILPTFDNCKRTFYMTCISSSTFALLAWVVNLSYPLGENYNEFVKSMVIFADIWFIVFVISLILNIVIKFFKNGSYDLKSALCPLIVRTVWLYILIIIIQ
jgi:hypothetical protein